MRDPTAVDPQVSAVCPARDIERLPTHAGGHLCDQAPALVGRPAAEEARYARHVKLRRVSTV